MRFIYVRPQQPVLVEIPEATVINVGIRLNDEARRGEHRHKREHDHSVRYESPLDTISAFQLRWELLCLREMISLRKHSDSFSFKVELNRVEIQDQRHPNGSIPQRTTLFIHRVEPDVKIPQSFDPTFRWPSVLSALGEERVATFNINFLRLWPSKRRVQGTTRPRGMAIYARHRSQGTRTAESETQGYEAQWATGFNPGRNMSGICPD